MVSLEEQPLGNSFEKVFIGNAGSAGGAGLDINEVFSTYLYTGTGQSLAINNGIDLDGEGGLTWFKSRPSGNHNLIDTERGNTKYLRSNTTDAEGTNTGYLTSFNSNGFTLGTSGTLNGTQDYASWTWRKAPKFFDIVTYEGNGASNRAIAHNLGTTPGMVIVKRTSISGSWYCSHRSMGATDSIKLSSDASKVTNSTFFPRAHTDTHFYVGSDGDVNDAPFSGTARTFVAYLFAHNNSDGEFGPDSDQDIIKCGSFTGGGDVAVDVGFEPQWVLTKATGLSQKWTIHDTMRGYTADATGQATLHPNLSDAEDAGVDAALTSTGFRTINSSSGQTYIYMAIRRGPLAPPEAATEVFKPVLATSTNAYSVGFETDFALFNKLAGLSFNTVATTRLQGGSKRLSTATTAAETSSTNVVEFDLQDSFKQNILGSSPLIRYHWKRAPGFFDVVAYTGENGMSGQTDAKPHNLGVVPEMIWIKTRSLTEREWVVWIDGFGTGQTNGTGTKEWLYLNTTQSLRSSTSASNVPWGGPHTATTFSTGSWSRVNDTGETYIAYLFASLDGVSKVGSYSGNGTTDGSKVIDCGFTSGARFVMIKTSNTGGDWMVYDTTRGIVVGNDPILSLNDTAAAVTTYDNLIPNSSGFAVIQNTDGAYTTNESGHSYIFYAIA